MVGDSLQEVPGGRQFVDEATSGHPAVRRGPNPHRHARRRPVPRRRQVGDAFPDGGRRHGSGRWTSTGEPSCRTARSRWPPTGGGMTIIDRQGRLLQPLRLPPPGSATRLLRVRLTDRAPCGWAWRVASRVSRRPRRSRSSTVRRGWPAARCRSFSRHAGTLYVATVPGASTTSRPRAQRPVRACPAPGERVIRPRGGDQSDRPVLVARIGRRSVGARPVAVARRHRRRRVSGSRATRRSPSASRWPGRCSRPSCIAPSGIPAVSSSACSTAWRRCASTVGSGCSRGGSTASATKCVRLSKTATAGCGWARRRAASFGSTSGRRRQAARGASLPLTPRVERFGAAHGLPQTG